MTKNMTTTNIETNNLANHKAINCIDIITIIGDTVLHSAARSGNEKAAIFLATHGAKPGQANHKVIL